jgi:hypothetical protein
MLSWWIFQAIKNPALAGFFVSVISTGGEIFRRSLVAALCRDDSVGCLGMRSFDAARLRMTGA